MSEAASSPVKILISGDVRGNFTDLLTRLQKVHTSKAGPFKCCLCVGTFFGENEKEEELQELVMGKKQIPLPIYFIASNEPTSSSTANTILDSMPDGGKVCTNLTYLGRAGVQTLFGLRVAYLSGTYNASTYHTIQTPQRNTKYDRHYIEHDVQQLTEAVGKDDVDILLTSEWGKGFHALLKAESYPPKLRTPITSIGSPIVARLATSTCTRYHFAGTEDVYFSLAPYTNQKWCTRFQAVGCVKGANGEKSLYACSLAPFSTVDTSIYPADCTSNPYTELSKKMAPPPTSSQPNAKRQKTSLFGGAFVSGGIVGGDKKHVDEEDNTEPSTSHIMDDTSGYSRWSMAADPTKARPMPGYMCRKCGRDDHYLRDCPQGKTTRGTSDIPPDGYICNKCHESGHYIRNCPMVQAEMAEREAKKADGIPPDGYVCKKCHETGHWIQKCPVVLAEQKERAERPPPEDYVCNKCDARGQHWFRNCPQYTSSLLGTHPSQRSPTSQPRHVTQKDCWFCLATSNVATHLIISIGTECYLALAKGYLVPEHVLILPVLHVSSMVDMSDAQIEELTRYKRALCDYYQSRQQRVMFYERNIPTRAAQHMHLQVIPLPLAAAEKAEQFFNDAASAAHLRFRMLSPAESLSSIVGSSPYLFLEFDSGVRLVHEVGNIRTPGLFDFARNTIAKLIEKPERADWKACDGSQDEETSMVEMMKSRFKPYDPNPDED